MQGKIRKTEERKMANYKKKPKKQKKLFSFREKQEYYSKRRNDEKLSENQMIYAGCWVNGSRDDEMLGRKNLPAYEYELKDWRRRLRKAKTVEDKKVCKYGIVSCKGVIEGTKAMLKEERKKWQNKK